MGTILVVDDTFDFLQTTVRLLRSNYHIGITVEAAESPEEALDRIDAAPFAYDVILTDLLFTNSSKDGVWLADQIALRREKRGYDPAPSVIAFTVEKQFKSADVIRALRILNAQFVSKMDPDLYLGAVDAALADLKNQRTGPHIIFEHSQRRRAISASFIPEKMKRCSSDEKLTGAFIARDGGGGICQIKAGLKELLLLDLMASPSLFQTPLRHVELADLLASEEFYKAHLKTKAPLRHPDKAILMNMHRLRVALQQTLSPSWDVEKVLVREYFTYADEDLITDTESIQLLRERDLGRKIPKGIRLPKTITKYRLSARRSVRHL